MGKKGGKKGFVVQTGGTSEQDKKNMALKE